MDSNPYAAPSTEPLTTLENPGPSGPSPYGPYRELRGLARVILVFLSLGICASAGYIYTIIAVTKANLLFETDDDAEPLVDRWIALSEQISLFESGIFLITAVLWCVWTNKSCKNAWLFRTGTGTGSAEPVTPGWAVGWYFIPILHLWKPFRAMIFIRNQVAGFFRGGPILALWWTSWIVMIIGSKILTRDRPLETTEEVNAYNQGLLIDSALTIVASILAGVVILTMTSAQQRAAVERGLRAHSS